MVIDFHKLNKATKKDHYPLTFIDQMLERFVGERSNFKKIPTHTQDHGDA